MTQKQKLIKGLAAALALFLICALALGVFGIFSSLMGIEKKDDNTVTFEYESTENNSQTDVFNAEEEYSRVYEYFYSHDAEHKHEGSDEIRSLDIKVFLADVVFVVGEEFSVSGNDENISVTTSGSTVYISEKQIFDIFKTDRRVVITVPSDKIFEKVRIDAGAGEITAECINASSVNFNFGAGDVSVDRLFVAQNALINAGVGEFTVDDAAINNLDMHFGVSNARITGVLFGETDVDCGVGNLELNLKGSEADYRIDAEKGTGQVTLNGRILDDDVTYGSGKAEISFDGGVGNVVIKTEY